MSDVDHCVRIVNIKKNVTLVVTLVVADGHFSVDITTKWFPNEALGSFGEKHGGCVFSAWVRHVCMRVGSGAVMFVCVSFSAGSEGVSFRRLLFF